MHRVGQQLVEIPVRARYDHRDAITLRLRSQCGDHIVRFYARHLHVWHASGI